jgi:hypothetical protein
VKLFVRSDLDQLRILCLVFLYCEDELPMCDVGLQNLTQELRRGCFIAACYSWQGWNFYSAMRGVVAALTLNQNPHATTPVVTLLNKV